MPAGDPWQKRGSGVSASVHRLAMVELLAAEDDHVVVDTTEIMREGPSYTIDTIEEMADRSVLILGADTALGLPSWHRSDDVLDMIDLVVAPRSGVSQESVEDALGRPVTWLEMEPIDLSSTLIRQLIRSGGDISALVPSSIVNYMEAEGLYEYRENRHPDSLSSAPMTKRSHTAAPDAIAAARAAAEALDEKSGEDIALLDLSDLLVVTDIFVLVTGTSRRNVLTLADETVDALRKLDRRPIRKEGTDHGKWVLLDYGDVVIHLFDRETRAYYDLERLWASAPRIEFEPSSSTTES